ncbi:MAG: M56 family metallopeptidase [Pirellulaceae bacterium]
MNDLLLLIAQNAVLLVAGSTLLLSLGCGAVLLCKSPIHRQRISELTIAGVLGWMVLALFPLPRLLPEHFFLAKPQAAAPESLVALETTEPLLARIYDTEPILLPEITEWVIEDANTQEADVGRSFQIVPDGLGSPTYFASPSEEWPGQSAASIPSTPPAWKLDRTQLAGLCTGAYLAGAALCVLWILAGHGLLLRIRQTGESPPEWLAKQYRILAKQSGIVAPQLIVSHLCTRPLTWGVLWPVVVLPRSLCRQENKSQLETILLHELGHIAQQDSQGNLLFCAALPLLYAHPLYWWLRRESQLAAELVADDWAAWQTGKETYVEELVALARCTGQSAIPLVGVTGLFSSPSQFYRRMHMLLAREKPLSTKTSLPWRLASLSALAGSVALAASLAGVRPVAGQTAPRAVEPPALVPDDVLPPASAPPAVATPPGASNTPVPLTPPLPTLPGATPPAVARPIWVPRITLPTVVEVPLSAEEAALLAEIKQLQAKLRGLEAKRNTTKQQAAVKTITILRDNGDGSSSTEVWTTDEKGQPAKMISNSLHRTRVLDAATGNPIAENRTSAVTPPRRTYVPSLGPGQNGVIPGEPIAREPNLHKDAQQLDLVSLATSYADAVGVLEAAEARVAENARLEGANGISQHELVAAKLALSAAQRKEQLLRKIAEVAREGAQLEMSTGLYNSDGSGGINAALAANREAKTRMTILEQILDTRPAKAAKVDSGNSKP